MLVEALTALLYLAVLLRFTYMTLRHGHTGTSVPLLAGGSASEYNALVSGIFTPNYNSPISANNWWHGSACVKLSSSNLFIKPLKNITERRLFHG